MPKNASLEHELWKEIMAERYREKGYDVEKEVKIAGGKVVDLVATKGNEQIAIETGESDLEATVERCRESGG